MGSGIADVISLGLKELPNLDPFTNMTPIRDDDSTLELNTNAICNLTLDEIEGYQIYIK